MTIAWPGRQTVRGWQWTRRWSRWPVRGEIEPGHLARAEHALALRLREEDGRGAGAGANAGTLPSVPLSRFLLHTASNGDPDRFEAFFHRHEHDIFGYLWRVTGEEQAAHDLCQECFLRAWQHFAKVSAYEQPRAWLFRVATNLALNHRRRQTVATGAITGLTPSAEVGGDPAASVAERDAVSTALLSLPARQRTALVLRVVYGLDFEQIAEVLGVSVAAAKMTLSRGREQFRTRYLHADTLHGEAYS